VAVRFAVVDEDRPVLDLHDAGIGDSHSEDIGGEVFKARFAGTYGLRIDIPIDLPDLRGDLFEEAGFSHRIAELGLEDDGESFDGEIEVDSGGVPETIGGGEGAAGDDVMDMGVIVEGSSPGVKDTEESWEITADIVFIEGEFFDGLRGSFKQGRIGDLLVLTDEAAQTLRDGKGEQEMVTGELPFHLFFKPLPALLVLAGGTMTVSAGAIESVELATFFALIDSHPIGLGAAGDDGIDDFTVDRRHGLGIAFEVLGTKGSEDLIDGCHGLAPPSPD